MTDGGEMRPDLMRLSGDKLHLQMRKDNAVTIFYSRRVIGCFNPAAPLSLLIVDSNAIGLLVL